MTIEDLIRILPPESPAKDGKPENYERDKAASRIYQEMSDEELLELIREASERLGRPPKKSDIPGFQTFKSRFGPWPRMLEKAGAKPLSPTKLRREASRRKKRTKKDKPHPDLKK